MNNIEYHHNEAEDKENTVVYIILIVEMQIASISEVLTFLIGLSKELNLIFKIRDCIDLKAQENKEIDSRKYKQCL